LKNFLIKYYDNESGLVTITIAEELYLAEELPDPQNLAHLYILGGIKLYYEAVVCEKAQEIFKVVQGELEVLDKEVVMASIGVGNDNEHVRYVECLERGRKVSGLMELILIRLNIDVVLAQCEEELEKE
jgi:hypothetical protein